MQGKAIFLTMLPALWLLGCDHKSDSKSPPPAQSGFSLSELNALRHNIWAARVERVQDAACSILYDFRRDTEIDFHVLCVAHDRKNIQIESYAYAIAASGDGFSATLQSSSCAQAPRNYSFTAAVNTMKDPDKTMLLKSGKDSLSLQALPEASLIADLRKATELHGKPLVRGCFAPSGHFVAQESAQ